MAHFTVNAMLGTIRVWQLLLAAIAFRIAICADFDWDIEPLDGSPTIAFGNGTNTTDNEIVFKYSYTGNLSATKYMTSTLLEKYCNGSSDSSLVKTQRNDTAPYQLEVDVDIVEETIRTSKFYKENADGTQATISFCLRVDYNYNNGGSEESINFHETSVTILVDLTANFTLAEINTGRTEATQMNESAQLDYPVQAYFCEENYDEVGFPTLTQGSMLQFCVKIDDSVVDPVFVADILDVSLSQPGGNANPSHLIANTINDPLTQKVCSEMGICNVQSQLTSKWFMDPFPEPLQVDGIALLSFGIASAMPSAAPTTNRRELRAVPVRAIMRPEDIRNIMSRNEVFPLPGRKLQGSSRTASDFNLKVSLLPGVSNDGSDGGEKSFTTLFIVGGCAAVLALVMCLLACRYCCRSKTNKTVEIRNAKTRKAVSKSPGAVSPAYDPSIATQEFAAAAATATAAYGSYYPEVAQSEIAYPSAGSTSDLYQPSTEFEVMMAMASTGQLQPYRDSQQNQPYLDPQQQQYLQQPSSRDLFMVEDFGFDPSGREDLSYVGGGGVAYDDNDDASSMWSFGQRDSRQAPDYVFQGSLVD